MDWVASCKEKLQYFRLKELKDVLTHLGLSKQGKKQDLVDRILAILSEDQVSKLWTKKNAVGKQQVAKLVDETYRKLQVSGAIDLSSKGQGASDSSNGKIKGEIDNSFQSDTKIRCLCGNVLDTEPLVKCEDTKCHVSQHINCVIIPEKPMDGIPPVPDKFYCEICRLDRADPFYVSATHLLFPVKLTTTNIPTDGTNPVQSVERTFQLTRANKELVSKSEYDVQVWCMLLNDKVSFRMQWPQFADLKVNGLPVRAINRPGSQLLGANGRDTGPVITPYTKDGINKISLTGCDARIFCLGVRIVKRLSMPECFFDTPGLMLNCGGFPYRDVKVRVESAWSSVNLYEVLIVIFDVHRHITRPDSRVIQLIKRMGARSIPNQRRILCMNKIDLVEKKKDLLKVAEEFKDLPGYERYFMISGLKGSGVKDLTQYLMEQAVQRPWEEDPFTMSEEVMKMIALEVVRERLLDHVHQEIPYDVEHRLIDWKELRDGSLRIEQHFITNKLSQCKILVGKNGSKIGRIGIEANEELRSIFKKQVHLILRVRHKK